MCDVSEDSNSKPLSLTTKLITPTSKQVIKKSNQQSSNKLTK